MTFTEGFCERAMLVLPSPYWSQPVSASTSGRPAATSPASGPKSRVSTCGQVIPRSGGGSGVPASAKTPSRAASSAVTSRSLAPSRAVAVRGGRSAPSAHTSDGGNGGAISLSVDASSTPGGWSTATSRASSR